MKQQARKCHKLNRSTENVYPDNALACLAVPTTIVSSRHERLLFLYVEAFILTRRQESYVPVRSAELPARNGG